MNILPINSQKQSYNMNFGAFKTIKHAKNAKCACCDMAMIDGMDVKKAFGAVSKPLSKMLQDGKFTFWLDKLPIWNVLVEFARNFPKDNLDKIILVQENYNKLVNSILAVLSETGNKLTGNILDVCDSLCNNSRSELKPARTTLKRFKTFREKLKDNEKETFDLLEYYAELYPKATLQEIVNTPEILNFHKDIHIKHRLKNERIRNLHFNRIDKMIEKENPEAKEIFAEVRLQGMKILLRDSDPDENLYRLKKLYKEALEQNGCERIVHKVMDELKQMPLKNIIADSFFGFAAYKKFNDGQIMQHLIKPSIMTFEHIEARSKGGKDSVTNGLLMCKKCNEERGNNPYAEVVEYHPLMPYYTQKQILQISDEILSGKIDGLSRYWPINISNTLRRNSEGKINPDLSLYIKKSNRRIQKAQKERNEQLDNYNANLEASQKELEELRIKMEALTKEIDTTKKEVTKLKMENGNDKKFQDTMNNYSEGNKK